MGHRHDVWGPIPLGQGCSQMAETHHEPQLVSGVPEDVDNPPWACSCPDGLTGAGLALVNERVYGSYLLLTPHVCKAAQFTLRK